MLNQPLDILISDGGSSLLTTITLTNDFEIYINMNEELWQTKAMAEASLASGDLTRIHFYNHLAWDAVYAYVADQTMILPTWPGIKAKQEGVEGRVFVKAYINEEGTVDRTEILKGIGSGCDSVAMKAIMDTKFTPGKQRGEPVKVQVSIPIVFQLK